LVKTTTYKVDKERTTPNVKNPKYPDIQFEQLVELEDAVFDYYKANSLDDEALINPLEETDDV